MFPFTGSLTFQQCGYFKYLRLDFGQHFILADKIYHQIGHFLTLMLQIVFQFFFLQLHNLLFLTSLLLFVLPFHIVQLFVLFDHRLLFFPLHTDIIPTINIPQGEQSQDNITNICGSTAIPRWKYTKGNCIQWCCTVRKDRLDFKRIFAFRQVAILFGTYRGKVGPTPLIQAILKADIVSYRKERKSIVKTNRIHGISYHRNRLLS